MEPVSNQLGSTFGSNGNTIAYPWGMTHNFVPPISNGGSFVPYQLFHMPHINQNFASHPWGMPPQISPSVINVDTDEVPQEQPRQFSIPTATKAPAENELEYRAFPFVLKFPLRLLHLLLNIHIRFFNFECLMLILGHLLLLLYLHLLILGHPMLRMGSHMVIFLIRLLILG